MDDSRAAQMVYSMAAKKALTKAASMVCRLAACSADQLALMVDSRVGLMVQLGKIDK
jgi:hypothetical protein